MANFNFNKVILGGSVEDADENGFACGTSVSGGVLHNFGQILVAWAVFGTRHIFLYLPILALTGTLTGVLIGVVAHIAVKRLNFGSHQPKN